MSDRFSLPPMPLPPMGVNWLGLWTLYLKEVRRFLNVYTQTVAAPVVTSFLFLAVFTLALGRGAEIVDGVPYSQFLGPGLIMMAMTQNAFANTSSSLVISKVQGNIVDLLMPPLSPAEVTLAMTAAGVTRGLLVGLVTATAMAPFVTLAPQHAFFLLFHAVMACTMLALLGMLGGLWSEKFDHMAAITNFLISPLAFLSGTFYTTTRLPPDWQTVAHLNPFFYMLDGFRYGFIDHADGSLAVGLIVMVGTNIALSYAVYTLIRTGYRLKS
ncbi:ABC transporter permease [Elstera cyanobacteriorum]|uniref:ABC transporter permease n=1 Tax=Elstera cyanobacteriorum TaxID=2022747 RepID=UPI002354B319|nr:ABC transporter permease [Elstera cyanobacteriorum]MCK6441649.1 ABC transporter permease [Elstera cyanobacteriorum]